MIFTKKTKTDVEGILENLDKEVDKKFDASNDKAQKAFERLVEDRMRAYKARRYSGVGGAFVWVGDVFTGLPEEVNDFLPGRDVIAT